MRTRLLVTNCVLAVCIAASPLLGNADSTRSSPVAAIGISTVIAATAASAGAFFLIRRNHRGRQLARQKIHGCESLYRQTTEAYARKEFRSARRLVDSAARCNDDYLLSASKLRTRPAFTAQDLEKLRTQIDALIELTPQFDRLMATVRALPLQKEAIVSVNKWSVKDTIRYCRARLADLERTYPSAVEAVRLALQPVVVILDSVDGLFLAVYEEERNTFALKARFHYNQALASRDTGRIRDFVADCDYYRNEKEYCERARDLFRPKVAVVAPPPGPVVSPMQAEFAEAMATQRLDLLEAYINKYSKRKKEAAAANLDAIRSVYEQRKKEVALVQAYNSAHPLLSDVSAGSPKLAIKGGDTRLEESVRESLARAHVEAAATLGAIRFPASVSLDLTQSTPLLLLNAFLHQDRDVRRTGRLDSGNVVIEIPGAPAGLRFLHQLTRQILDAVSQDRRQALERANYAVRLWTNDTDYLTFYGRSPGAVGDMQLFDFFDLTVKDLRDLRTRKSEPFRIVLRDPNPAANPERAIHQFFVISGH